MKNQMKKIRKIVVVFSVFVAAIGLSNDATAQDWSDWKVLEKGVDWAVKCRKVSGLNDETKYVWTFKFRNKNSQTVKIKYNYLECKDCTPKSIGGTAYIRPQKEYKMTTDYYTTTLPCGSKIWISSDIDFE